MSWMKFTKRNRTPKGKDNSPRKLRSKRDPPTTTSPTPVSTDIPIPVSIVSSQREQESSAFVVLSRHPSTLLVMTSSLIVLMLSMM